MSAYSWEKLKSKCQEKGGPDAEKFLKSNWEAVKEWLLESAVESETKVDDITVPMALPIIDGVMQKVLDQVDGVHNG